MITEITFEFTKALKIYPISLAELQMNLSINQNADATLKRFQEWQRTMNPGDDTHPNHHDCAILISKYASQATVCRNFNPRSRGAHPFDDPA